MEWKKKIEAIEITYIFLSKRVKLKAKRRIVITTIGMVATDVRRKTLVLISCFLSNITSNIPEKSLFRSFQKI